MERANVAGHLCGTLMLSAPLQPEQQPVSPEPERQRRHHKLPKRAREAEGSGGQRGIELQRPAEERRRGGGGGRRRRALPYWKRGCSDKSACLRPGGTKCSAGRRALKCLSPLRVFFFFLLDTERFGVCFFFLFFAACVIQNKVIRSDTKVKNDDSFFESLLLRRSQ